MSAPLADPLSAAIGAAVLAAGLLAPALRAGSRKGVARKDGPGPRREPAPEEAAGPLHKPIVLPSAANDLSPVSIAARRSVLKRGVDIAGALVLLAVFSPLMLLAAIVIRLDSPGPAFYRQRRIGLDGAPFHIYKLRTMVVDAEKNGACWAAPDDMRITRIGRILRKRRFDEIPQAINVLRGDMSLVGPRPERPEFVQLLEREIPGYCRRHAVRPGITGLAQVSYVYGASVEDARVKQRYDLDYIARYSAWRDVLILLSTAKVALFGLGSR